MVGQTDQRGTAEVSHKAVLWTGGIPRSGTIGKVFRGEYQSGLDQLDHLTNAVMVSPSIRRDNELIVQVPEDSLERTEKSRGTCLACPWTSQQTSRTILPHNEL